MPTRLYITNKTAEYLDTIGALRGSWDGFHTPNLNMMIDTNKFGDPMTLHEMSSNRLAVPWRLGTYRGITRRLMPQTIDGTFDIFTFIMQTFSIEAYNRVHVYVLDTTSGDYSGTLFATLVDRYEESVASPVAYWSFQVPSPTKLRVPVAITPVTIPDDGRDYRLVVEMGGISRRTTPGLTFGIRQEIGARKTDLTPLDDIPTSGGLTYFDFSADILFKDSTLPGNHEIEFSLEVASLPALITDAPHNGHPLWYKYLPSFDGVIGFHACNTDPYKFTTAFYMQEPIGYKLWITSELNQAIDHPIQTGKYVYFKTWPSDADADVPINLQIELAATGAAQSGDLLLTAIDDFPNLYDSSIRGLYHTTIRTPPGPGPIRTLTGKFTASNLAVTLAAGRFGIVNKYTKELFIYGKAPQFQLLNRVDTRMSLGVGGIGTDFNSFYVLGRNPTVSNGENRFVYRINAYGDYHPLQWVLPLVDASPLMGVNRNSTILYYGQNIAGGKVHRHNLSTIGGTALTPFVTSPGAAYVPTSVIVMSDDSICCHFRFLPIPSNQDKLYHYAPDGTVLHIVSLAGTGNSVVQYIAHASDDSPDKVWVWYYNLLGTGAVDGFLLTKLSDGTAIQQWGGDLFLFHHGKGPTPMACDKPIWGAQSQAAMITMMDTPNLSGVYFLNSSKKHDTYYYDVEVKIPDPTIRTAFFGE